MGTIDKVCVIGAGTMGTGIAAQVANAGGTVLLLDVAGEGAARNAAAERGLARIRKAEPPLLMVPDNIERIAIGNIADDLAKIADCDWIVEAVVERLDVKQALYRSMLPHLNDSAMVSSNTSTIPIALLMGGMPEDLRRRFAITHFFNPVRYMRLLELVSGEDTAPEVMAALADYCDRSLGKGVVVCADTPGFLGNRVGVFAMQAAIHEAMAEGIKIEQADAIFGRPMGIPKTGAFALYDLIGVDLMADVVRSLRAILPEDDPFHAIGGENALINRQIERGFIGNKGKGGFYAVIDGAAMALDLESGDWRPREKDLPPLALRGEREGIGALIAGDDRLSRFAWRVLARILTYAASLVPSVTENPQDIDDAMKLGYNWQRGPFELIDAIGAAAFVARLDAEDRPVPPFLRDAAAADAAFYAVKNGALTVRHADGDYRPVDLPKGVVRFHLMRRTLEPVERNASASLYHLNGDVRLVEFHSKANALDAGSMAIVRVAAKSPGRGVLIHNDGQHFSAGVNLARFRMLIEAGDWQGIDAFLLDFQQAVEQLLYSESPVIGAPSGLAIGGGYEVLAHCDKVVAHANSVLGLVETLVGLVPGGGGVKETYWRWYNRSGNWREAARKTFDQIGYAKTGSSPMLAAKLAYFELQRDEWVMNRDRLVEASLAALNGLAADYRPREKPVFKLAGGDAYEKMRAFLDAGQEAGKFTAHDVTTASQIAWIVTGGVDAAEETVSESDMFARERAAFVRLAKTPETYARIASMLDTGKPVRN